MSDEYKFFQLRRAARTYLSKVFTWGSHTTERLRNVRMVMEGSDVLHLGEVEGALCLRLSGEKRKTQSRKGEWYQGYEEYAFTFRDDEFERLVAFLDRIAFINLSNEDRFDIEDISAGTGRKIIIDAADRALVERIRALLPGVKARNAPPGSVRLPPGGRSCNVGHPHDGSTVRHNKSLTPTVEASPRGRPPPGSIPRGP